MSVRGILVGVLALAATGCACSKAWHGDSKLPTELVIVNPGPDAICGVYIWRPERAGGSLDPKASPESNNALKRGTYMVAEGHPDALKAGDERRFDLHVQAGDRFTVRARDCEENVVFERVGVCLRSASPVVFKREP